ncbi:MAG TPA: CopG family transcriptional regulator [Candidatus Binatia bacterium]|nr:CopG family transcriptional regulator [Candidatus Binatia bacterium]
MLRTQIQLTEEQAAALRRLARQRGVSMAAIVREATEAFLREADLGAERRELAREVVGKYASGRADIAREHDRELGELFGR